MRRTPWVTLAAVALAIVVHAAPGAFEAMLYDRARVATGEWWRLATSALAHASAQHLVYDALALFAGGIALEHEDRRGFAALMLVAAVGSNLAVHLASPEVALYGGLSAVAYAALAAAVVRALDRPTPFRPAWALVGLALAARLLYDFASDRPALVADAPGVRVAGIAHLAACLVGLLWCLAPRLARLTSESPRGVTARRAPAACPARGSPRSRSRARAPR